MGMTLIAVAPNGARKTKESHPALPMTIEEIAQDAKDCLDAGAGMIHLHVRDELGHHSLSVDIYREAIAAINTATDNKILIQVTTEAVNKYAPDEQFGMIHELNPEVVSIALREIKKLEELDIFENFDLMRKNNIYPQLILYNLGDLAKYHYWLEEGVLPGKAYPVLLVLGKSHALGSFQLSDLQAKPEVIASSIMVCAFGEEEYAAGKLALEHGWHIRLGFENNQLLANGEEASKNAELVSQMANYLKEQNQPLTIGDKARAIFVPDW